MRRLLSDLLGTLSSQFRVGNGALDTASLTGERSYQLPDKSGVVALLSDIASGGGEMVEEIPLTLTGVGQTVVEVPGGYAGDYVIFLVRNGSMLAVGSDYDADDGLTIELKYPVVSLSESLVVFRFGAFLVANTYTQTQINALFNLRLQDLMGQVEQMFSELPIEVSSILSSAATNNTVTPATIMQIDLPKAGLYSIEAVVRFRTPVTTTGMGLSLLGAGEVNAQVSIPQAAAGTASFFESSVNASASVVLSTAVLAANTDYVALISGSYVATGAESLQLQMRSEVAGSLVTVQPNSYISAREVK